MIPNLTQYLPLQAVHSFEGEFCAVKCQVYGNNEVKIIHLSTSISCLLWASMSKKQGYSPCLRHVAYRSLVNTGSQTNKIKIRSLCKMLVGMQTSTAAMENSVEIS